jgi:class 3 adenylate cyclase/TolB-like protein
VAPQEDESKQTRHLCAVLLADMTGYSRLMGESEAQAIDDLHAVRDVFADIVPRHNGTLEVFVGDCFVALFRSAVEAVRAAVGIQTELDDMSRQRTKPLLIRIGVHMGDVVRTATGLFGDSINIAARVQAIAPPGGISVSEDIYRAVRNRLEVPFRDRGPQILKNVRDPIRVFDVRREDAARLGESHAPSLRERVAALPFVRSARAPRTRAWIAATLLLIAGAAYLLARTVPIPAVRPVTQTAMRVLGPRAADALVIGVMEIRPQGEAPQWMCEFTRDGLNTVLSKLDTLRVYSKQKIDFLREKRNLTEIEAAEQLGIGKMISGSLSTKNDRVKLQIQVVDIETGLLEGSEEVHGRDSDLVEMQNGAARHLVRALKVAVTPDQLNKVFARRTNDQLESYKLLTETMGGFSEDDEEKDPPEPSSGDLGQPTAHWSFPWPAVAAAQEGGETEAAQVRALLERYRTALEAENLEQLSAIHVAMNPKMEDALVRYFENADTLKVEFSNFDILVEGDEALATFTRSDDFKDAKSGRPMHLEIRVSSVIARQDGAWKIRALRKPS